MPSRYWVPFLDISGPVDPTFVHAAVSRWFDHDHSEVTKPYAISPVWDREGNSGIVVSTLTHEADPLGAHDHSSRGAGVARHGHMAGTRSPRA